MKAQQRTCPCGCGKTPKAGHTYAGRGCALRASSRHQTGWRAQGKHTVLFGARRVPEKAKESWWTTQGPDGFTEQAMGRTFTEPHAMRMKGE